MNYKKVLEAYNLIEGVDFTLSANGFEKIAKIRQVEQVIHHEAIPAVMNGETVIEAAVPAWDENVVVNETYYANFPSEAEMIDMQKHIDISECEMALLVGLFLEGKDSLIDIENDSLNIVNNQIHSWDFKNIPMPTRDELHALVAVLKAKNSKEAKLAQIAELEAQITNRRLREAVLSGDNSFIANIDAQIAAIRGSI